MKCQRCQSEKLADVCAKCSDLCWMNFHPSNRESDGYVPDGLGIGGGDYVEFTYCRTCGQIQGNFPVRSG